MATEVTIQVNPAGPYTSALQSAVNDAIAARDDAQSALSSVNSAAATVMADKNAADASRAAAESAAIAAYGSAALAAGQATTVLAGIFAYDRYRDAVEAWSALGVTERPTTFMQFQ